MRWAEGAYTMDSLFAYSAVGMAGLDTVPLPGAVTLGQLKRIFSDVALLATRCNLPISTRLIPAPGKIAGDMTDFGGTDLFNTIVHRLS